MRACLPLLYLFLFFLLCRAFAGADKHVTEGNTFERVVGVLEEDKPATEASKHSGGWLRNFHQNASRDGMLACFGCHRFIGQTAGCLLVWVAGWVKGCLSVCVGVGWQWGYFT